MDHINEAQARTGNPPVRAEHHHTTTAVLEPAAPSSADDEGGYVLTSSVSRGVHAVNTSPAPEQSSGPHYREQRSAMARQTAEARAEADAVLDEPPVQFVQTTATLKSTTPASPGAVASLQAAAPAALPHTASTDDAGRRLDAVYTPVEAAVRVPERARRHLQASAGGADAGAAAAASQVRAAAKRNLRASAFVAAGADHVPRRLVRVQSEAAGDATDDADLSVVLFDVSPTAHVAAHGSPLFDVPPEYAQRHSPDEHLHHFSLGVELRGGLQHFIECSSASGGASQPDRKAAMQCFIQLVREARTSRQVLLDVLAALRPEELELLELQYPKMAQSLMAVAAAIGCEDSQRALAAILLSIDYETPEVKSYVDAHTFFHVVSAMSDLTFPGDVTFDALHTSLEQHRDHLDQRAQLMLALGTLGAALERGHPQQERALATLHAAFDEAHGANKDVEARFARHLVAARAHLEAMPDEEYHTWLAHANYVDKRSWAETWTTATDAERAELVERAVDASARILADNHGEDDGYGVQADYRVRRRHLSRSKRRRSRHRRQRRTAEAEGDSEKQEPQGEVSRPRAHPGSPGYNEAFTDMFAVQASQLRYAVQALANLGHPESHGRVLSLVSHRKLAVRAFAVHALSAFPSPEARRVLLDVMHNERENLKTRAVAVDALGEWPMAHLRDGEASHGISHVVDSTLHLLSKFEGRSWAQCEMDCARQCSHRMMDHCQRSCARRCKGHEELEMAAVALLHARWGHTTAEYETEADRETHARRLAGLPVDGTFDHGDAVTTRRLAGARRLAKTLEEWEAILQFTKFRFRVGFDEGWDMQIGKRSLLAAYIGAGLKNIFEINIGLFSGFVEVNIDNFAQASIYLLGTPPLRALVFFGVCPPRPWCQLFAHVSLCSVVQGSACISCTPRRLSMPALRTWWRSRPT